MELLGVCQTMRAGTTLNTCCNDGLVHESAAIGHHFKLATNAVL